MFHNTKRQIAQFVRNITCQVPLCCVDECQFKKYEKVDKYRKSYKVNEQLHLELIDPYWAEFLKAQQQSSANYLYHMQIYGNSPDPTLVTKNAFSPELIHQRLLHMPIVGALDKGDMFYIVSFLLNLFQLKSWKQKEVMETFQDQGLLDNEILNYMQIIARHPNTGVPVMILDDFLKITNDLINRTSTICNTSYFNPDRIFIKSTVEMDPYELAYLKDIMGTKRKLDKYQYMYLVNFVERLHEMPLVRRDQYLKALYAKTVLSTPHFATIVSYMKKKSTKFNRQKLITLWNYLVALMDIGPCFPQPESPPKVKEPVTEIDIDALKVQKALQSLMKGGIPNIVSVMNLKKFLQDIMHLNAEQLAQTLNQLKNMSLISLAQFKFILDFISKEKLEGDKEGKQLLMKMIQKIASTPPSTAPSVVLSIAASKGSNTEIGKEKTAISMAEEKSKQNAKSEVKGQHVDSKKIFGQEDKDKITEKSKKCKSKGNKSSKTKNKKRERTN